MALVEIALAAGGRSARPSGRWRGSAACGCRARTRRGRERRAERGSGWGRVGWDAARSGLPAHEVLVDAQPGGGALLGMELGGENIILRHRAGKGAAVVGSRRLSSAAIGRDHDSSCARNRSSCRRRCPSHSGCACDWRTRFQPMCGTLRRCRPRSPVLRRGNARHGRRTGPDRARCRPPRCARTASARRCRRASSGLAAAARRTAASQSATRAGSACSRASRPGPGNTTRAAASIAPASLVITPGLAGAHARAPWRPSAGCPCRSRRRRSSLRAAAACAPEDRAAYERSPWCDGMTPAARGSGSAAIRSARPKALKTVSH